MKNTSLRRIFSLLLCLCLFVCSAAPAFADDGAEGLIDEAELQALVDSFVEEHGLDPKKFSIGYVHTGSGEEWYYNGDAWYYPASVYKVPLMMILAEKVSSGELSQDSEVEGLTVSKLEEYIISYSNNDFAHTVRRYLGGDEAWRQEAKKFTKLEDSYYSSDYLDYCYFSPRYITEVLKTLYNESERFPNIIESMLVAEPTHYFRLSERMNNEYEVAQKYGSFCDNYGDNFNHTVGIIYTPTPFILTVMTLNAPSYEKVISDAAVMFTDYTLSLDAELEAYLQAQAEAEQKAAEEEQKRIEEEQAQAQQEAQNSTPAEPEEDLTKEEKKGSPLLVIAIGFVALLIVLLLIVLLKKRQKRRRYEEYERRFRYELEQHRRRPRR